MAKSEDFSTAVTDAVSQINSLVVGLSPATAMGSQCLVQSFNTSMAALNTVQSQQQSNIVHQAATVENVIKMNRS
nr:RebB family R body protein [uncultured Desulfobacter sp.]